jgi:hypothetical protein
MSISLALGYFPDGGDDALEERSLAHLVRRMACWMTPVGHSRRRGRQGRDRSAPPSFGVLGDLGLTISPMGHTCWGVRWPSHVIPARSHGIRLRDACPIGVRHPRDVHREPRDVRHVGKALADVAAILTVGPAAPSWSSSSTSTSTSTLSYSESSGSRRRTTRPTASSPRSRTSISGSPSRRGSTRLGYRAPVSVSLVSLLESPVPPSSVPPPFGVQERYFWYPLHGS